MVFVFLIIESNDYGDGSAPCPDASGSIVGTCLRRPLARMTQNKATDELYRLTSEVISLRERVAQAELQPRIGDRSQGIEAMTMVCQIGKTSKAAQVNPHSLPGFPSHEHRRFMAHASRTDRQR